MLDSLWILVCVALVFVMQGGFLCLESGLTRSKDAINVALKNMTDFSISMLLFWAFGFAFMFGDSYSGWVGTTNYFVAADAGHSTLMTQYLFQAMFCAAAATIVSGAVAGRMRFFAYILTTLIISGLVYPIFGHWAWGGKLGGDFGWLAAKGFVDFAGSTVVHSVGGWGALAAVLVIGPRLGRFDDVQSPNGIPNSNLSLAMLGAMLLWVGWLGFNGGSTSTMNAQVPGIIGNTFLAGSAGMLSALIVGWIAIGHADVVQAINGSLAGLVSVTASCHAITAPAAIIIGAGGAMVMLGVQAFLNNRKIDDAIGVIPVHLAAGVWGTIAVALFADLKLLETGLSRWEQLQVQLGGISTAFAVTFGSTYPLLRVIDKFFPLRVTAEQERVGLNVAEHDASTELDELLREMQEHHQSGDFSQPVSVESYSEVGIIASQYNRVLDRVSQETSKAAQLAEAADLAKQDVEHSYRKLEAKVDELNEFKTLAEGRELRMIELKKEINELSAMLGKPLRYNVSDQDALESSQKQGEALNV